MNVGRFKHLITLQKPDYTREVADKFGRRVTPYDDFAQVNAQAADVSGREFYEAAAHQLQNTVTFTLRYLEGVTQDMRIMFDGVAYEIDQINNLGYRRDFMRIKAHATEAEGACTHGEL